MMRTLMLSLVVAVLWQVSSEARGNTQGGAPEDARSEGQALQVPKAAVVAIMKEAGQALLWDGDRGEYVVVRVGDRFHLFVVTAIDADRVVLSHGQANQHVVLPRTTDTSEIASAAARAGAKPAAKPVSPQPRPAANAESPLVNPYAAAAVSGERPAPPLVNPYDNTAAAASPAAASPPLLEPYSSSITSSKAAASPLVDPYSPAGIASKDPASPLVDPYSPAGIASKKTPSPAPRPATRPGRIIDERYTVSRREFDAAVTDFHQVGKEVQLRLTDVGVEVVAIARGSLFYRWGLRAKDVVLSVDGHPIRGLDDAAFLYARLVDAKRFVVKIRRQPDTVILRYRFGK